MSKRTIIFLIIIIAIVGVSLLYVFTRQTTDTGENEGFISWLFPSSDKGPTSPQPPETPPSFDDLSDYRDQISLLQLTKESISGATFTNGKVRYVEKATGHFYESNPHGEEIVPLSNKTIPRVIEVLWSPDADSTVLRALDEKGSAIKNFTTSFNESNSLPQNITAIAASPEENKIFYLFPSGSQTIGVRADFENRNQTELLATPFGDFLISWPEKNTLSLITKPSGLVDGFLYRLNSQTGYFSKILGNIKGLTARWSSDAGKIIYSESSNNTVSAYIWDVANSQKTNFQFKTLPEKCIFSKISKDIIYCAVPVFPPQAIYPDDWYQGNISFSDEIWEINTLIGKTTLLTDNKENLDVINPFLDPEERYLFFTNKKDNTLWRLKLAGFKAPPAF